MEPSDNPPDLFAIRRAKLDAIRALGIDPYGARFDTTGSIADIRSRFGEELENA